MTTRHRNLGLSPVGPLGACCKSVNRGVKGHSAHVIRPQNAQLRHLEARFQSFREHPTADSVDLASRRTFATDS